MHLLRGRGRANPDSDLLLRSVCHELRPSLAALSALAKALDRAPAEDVRSELTRLTVEHTMHAAAALGLLGFLGSVTVARFVERRGS